jgi:hypothetical protein
MSTSTNSNSTTVPPDSDGGSSSSSSNNNSNSEIPIVEELYSASSGSGGDANENQVLVGYACQQVLTQNVVNEFDLVFYIDLASKVGQQAYTVGHIQQLLVPQMGTRYGISAEDGERCSQLPVDGSTWVVEFTIDPADFVKVDLFGE